MQETGIVTELNGNMATLKVIRKVPIGCGCGKAITTEEIFIEVKNLCNAKLNDEVVLGSTHDELRYRSTIRACGTVFAFILGAAAGELLFPHLGVSFYAPFSLALGIVLGVFAFLAINRHFRKQPLPAQAALAVLDPASP